MRSDCWIWRGPSDAGEAQFLGVELQSFYKERLLVVMPSGFGIYRGGRSTAAEVRVLAGLQAGASADDVTSSAAGAVQKLQQALSDLTRGDSEPPRRPTVLWRVPRSVKASKLKFCVLAADPTGNLSTANCAKLQLT